MPIPRAWPRWTTCLPTASPSRVTLRADGDGPDHDERAAANAPPVPGPVVSGSCEHGARHCRRSLSAGARQPNAIDATGATALTTASQEQADQTIMSALLAAGAKLDFLTAIAAGHFDQAEAMWRADPSRIGLDGADTIALHLAVNKRNLTAIRWLLAHGVALNAKRSMWDCNHTALHMTVESGALEIARLLLAAGADPNIRDDKYQATALGWSEFFGRKDFAELIAEKGGV